MSSLPRPDGHHSLTPAAVVSNAAEVITFLERAFGGRVITRYDGPGGMVAHAEVMIGDSVLMLGEPRSDDAAMPAVLSYYVDDGPTVDVVYQRALDAGATSVNAPEDQFYGYRAACVRDAGGNRWTICAVIETLTEAQIHERMAQMMGD